MKKISKMWMRSFVLFIGVMFISCLGCYAHSKSPPNVKIKVQADHGGLVTSLAFSPNSNLLVSSSNDNTIKLWEVSTGRGIGTLMGHSESVNAVAISSNGRLVVSASDDNTIKLWDVYTGRLLRTLKGHMGDVTAVAVSPNGKILASSNGERTGGSGVPDYGEDEDVVKIWDMNTGRVLNTLGNNNELVDLVGYLPNGTLLVSGRATGNLRIMDARGEKRLQTFGNRGIGKPIVWLLPDGRIISGNNQDEGIKLRDVKTGNLVFELATDPYDSILISPDGNRLITASIDGVIKVWSIASGSLLHTLHTDSVINIAISPDGRVLATGGREGQVRLWNMATGVLIRPLPVDSENILLATPDGKSLVSGSKQGRINMWDLTTGRVTRTLTGTSSVDALGISPDSATLVSASVSGDVRYWDIATGRLTNIIKMPYGFASAIAISPDTKILAAADGINDSVTLWDLVANQELIALQQSPFGGASANGITFSPDNKTLAANGYKMYLTLWNNETGYITSQFNTGIGLSVAFSPDANLLASATVLGVQLYDVNKGMEIYDFNIDSTVSSVAFSPDGKALLTAGQDNSLKIWDVKSRRVLRVLHGIVGETKSIVITPNGKTVVSSSSDNNIKIWDFSEGRLLATLISMGEDGFVVMTPEGYFDASSYEAADSINVVQGMKVQGVGNFWDVFYRPDLVQAKLRGEDIRSLIGDLTLDKALQNPPPRVVFGETPMQTQQIRMAVPYEIKSQGGGISEIRVFHNGKLVQSDGWYKDAVGKTLTLVAARSLEASAHAKRLRSARGGTNKDEVAGAKPPPELIVRKATEKKCDPCKGVAEIEVLPGEENTVTVVAFNRDGTIHSAPATVRFQSTLPKQEPRLWIFPVGIDRYVDARFGKLHNAGKDAQDFVCTYAGKEKAKRLGLACDQPGAANGLFKPENVHVVTPLFDQGAGKAAILNGLAEVAAKARPQDTFVWFVSGHGMMDANSVFGIIAHDTQCTVRDGKGNCTDVRGHITSNEILEASKKIKAMKQLMVLDTCQSGGLDDRLSGLYDARMSGLAKNMGLHMYAAAQSTEEAQDGIPGNNGVFTAQLLEGLRGKASDANNDQRISIVELGDFARTRTVDQSRTSKYPQHPVVKHFGQDAPLLRAGGVR